MSFDCPQFYDTVAQASGAITGKVGLGLHHHGEDSQNENGHNVKEMRQNSVSGGAHAGVFVRGCHGRDPGNRLPRPLSVVLGRVLFQLPQEVAVLRFQFILLF